MAFGGPTVADRLFGTGASVSGAGTSNWFTRTLSLIHISEPPRP